MLYAFLFYLFEVEVFEIVRASLHTPAPTSLSWIVVVQSLLPAKARLVLGDSAADRVKENGGAEPLYSVEVPTQQVRPGDRVLVLPGESLPVDVSPHLL